MFSNTKSKLRPIHSDVDVFASVNRNKSNTHSHHNLLPLPSDACHLPSIVMAAEASSEIWKPVNKTGSTCLVTKHQKHKAEARIIDRVGLSNKPAHFTTH